MNIINETEQELLEVPVPAKTLSYSPVSHRNIINEVREQLDRHNLIVERTSYNASKDGTRVIGFMDIRTDEYDIGMRLGFRNSYDKSMSLAIVSSGNVWICSNGMVSGDMQFIRKHTGGVLSELKEKINIGIEQLSEKHEQHVIFMNKTKNIPITMQTEAFLLGELFFEKGIITPTQASYIKKEREAEVKEFEEFHDHSCWGLYNQVTTAMRNNAPNNYFQKHTQLHEYVENKFAKFLN